MPYVDQTFLLRRRREALKAGRPMLLETTADPTVPPHIIAKQICHHASALLHGDLRALQVAKAGAREWWDGVVVARKRAVEPAGSVEALLRRHRLRA